MLYPHSCSSLPTQSAHQRHQLSDFNQQILKGMTAGILAAAISKSAVAPMDRVKLVLQVLFNCFLLLLNTGNLRLWFLFSDFC